MKIRTQLIGLMVVGIFCVNRADAVSEDMQKLFNSIEKATEIELNELKKLLPAEDKSIPEYQEMVTASIEYQLAKFNMLMVSEGSKAASAYYDKIPDIVVDKNDRDFDLIKHSTQNYIAARNDPQEQAMIIAKMNEKIEDLYNRHYISFCIEKDKAGGLEALKQFANLNAKEFKANIALLKDIFKSAVTNTQTTYLTGQCFTLTLNPNDSYKKIFREELGIISGITMGKDSESLLKQALVMGQNNSLYAKPGKLDAIINDMNKKIDYVLREKQKEEAKKQTQKK